MSTDQILIATLLFHPGDLHKRDIQPEHLEHLGFFLKAIQTTFQATVDTHPKAVSEAILTKNPETDRKELTRTVAD